MQNTNRFIELLQAGGPAAEQAGAMKLFGQFIGSWEGRARSRSYHADEYGEVWFDDESAFHEHQPDRENMSMGVYRDHRSFFSLDVAP